MWTHWSSKRRILSKATSKPIKTTSLRKVRPSEQQEPLVQPVGFPPAPGQQGYSPVGQLVPGVGSSTGLTPRGGLPVGFNPPASSQTSGVVPQQYQQMYGQQQYPGQQQQQYQQQYPGQQTT